MFKDIEIYIPIIDDINANDSIVGKKIMFNF